MPDLQGVTVVITRPEHQAQSLRTAIEAAGGRVILFPVLDIAPPQDPAAALALIQRIAEFDLAIFISPNAVEYGLRELARVGGIPSSLKIAAVGAGTARALAAAGHPVQLFPKSESNSEALLALDELHQVVGKQIIIFRGEGGREHLADTLRTRGAHVEYAEVYRRVKPNVDPGPVLDAWAKNRLDAVVITSNESLQNFFDLIGAAGLQHLRNTQLLVTSQRAAELAHRLGVQRAPMVVSPVSDDAILNTLTNMARASKVNLPPLQDEGRGGDGV